MTAEFPAAVAPDGPTAISRDLTLSSTDAVSTRPFNYALPGDTSPPQTFTLREFLSEFEIRHYTREKLGYFKDQQEVDVAAAKYIIFKEVERQLIQGKPDVTPGELSSLDFTIDTLKLGQSFATSADPLIDMDVMRAEVTAFDGAEVPNMFYLMNWDAQRAVLNRYRTVGGQTPVYGECPDEAVRLMHNGVPVYVSNFIPTDVVDPGNPKTTAYAVLTSPKVGAVLAVHEDYPDPIVYETELKDSPFTAKFVQWNVELATFSDRAIVRITDFPALLPPA